MDRILQEITAVSNRLEGMATAITSLKTESKSTRLDIAGFQSRVTGLEHRMVTVEAHVHTVLEKDQELEFLRSELIDLEDRSQRDNIRLFGFPEHTEGTDTPSFLRSILPQLTNTVFELPLEFQRPQEERRNLQTSPDHCMSLETQAGPQAPVSGPSKRTLQNERLRNLHNGDFSRESTNAGRGSWHSAPE
ncbi:hypothetical protein NDU88_004237 [Pleurodeles waltl]|uniref:Uncharacterized protein n=1 Tax=Pleurodeles waltl TaxID=8319 RepID=A0AAV7VGH8_PLEWA|nr:hypothetical protein NDU88_004237 [Pleurodeles waltl]